MAGRRRTGSAAAGALDLARTILLQRQEDARARRDRSLELAEKFKTEMTLEALKRGQIVYDPITGALSPNPSYQATPQIPSGLEASGLSYTDPSGIRRSFGRPAQDKALSFLPEASAAKVLGEASPGTPLPRTRQGGTEFNPSVLSNIPVGPAGVNTLNAAILQGRTESPAIDDAGVLGLRPALHTIPQGPFVEGPIGTFIGGSGGEVSGLGVPRSRVVDLVRTPPSSVAPASSVPRAPVLDRATRPAPASAVPSPTPEVDASALLADASAALAEGFSREEVEAQLLDLGVDPDTAASILDDAGF